MKNIILNAKDNTVKIVDVSSEQIAEFEKNKTELEAKKAEEVTAKAQKEADALAGNNKLLELGLTQAQVTAMTGYTPPVAE
jgi:hypothetical protein